MVELQLVNYDDFEIDRQQILDMIPGKSRDFIEDTLDDLIEDWEGENIDIRPYAQWMELPVEPVDQEHVKIGSNIYEDAYLTDRLKGIDKVFAYYSECSEALMTYYEGLDDALDRFIMNYALIGCLNKAFEAVVEAIADKLPDYCTGCMDNPGVEGRWKLDGNQDIVNSFRTDAENGVDRIELLPNSLNKNKFSYMGLIYGVMPEGKNGPWRKKLDIHALSEEIKEASGH